MFLSSFESSVDVKKRVSIPASFRKALGGEESVFLWPSLDKPCLEGGGMALVEGFEASISELDLIDERRFALATAILGLGKAAKFDEGGRIVLETDMLAHAGIEDKVRFVGLGDRFQIWAPPAHQALLDDILKLARSSANLLKPKRIQRPGPAAAE